MTIERFPTVYILANHENTVLYIGVTSNPVKRIWEHRNKVVSGFSNTYHLYKLVYYECFETMEEAITREKQLKHWTRKKKESLINKQNSQWVDRYEEIAASW